MKKIITLLLVVAALAVPASAHNDEQFVIDIDAVSGKILKFKLED